MRHLSGQSKAESCSCLPLHSLGSSLLHGSCLGSPFPPCRGHVRAFRLKPRSCQSLPPQAGQSLLQVPAESLSADSLREGETIPLFFCTFLGWSNGLCFGN